jgi:hypothetical protein
MTFQTAVQRTRHLERSYQPGLQALRRDDREHVDVENPRSLAGSVDIDTALQHIAPNASRWDYAIGYRHANRREEVIYWLELHAASDGEVGPVIRKARWLLDWLSTDGSSLRNFDREVVWVSTGATTFTLSSPQRKRMAQVGLQHRGRVLRIRERRRD